MFERYTEKARRAIFFARYEASQFGSDFITSEHLLLGLLHEDDGLRGRLGIGGSEALRQYIFEQHSPPAARIISTSVDLPVDQACKEALSQAAREADKLGHSKIVPGHLVLALLSIETSVAAQALHARGIEYQSYRHIVVAEAPTSGSLTFRPKPLPSAVPAAEPEQLEVAAPALHDVCNALASLVDKASPELDEYSEADGFRSLASGQWIRKVALGHLIDWACVHQVWLARALTEPKLAANGYPDAAWVTAQKYRDVDWSELTDVWVNLNRLLVHVIAQVPEAKLNTPCRIGLEEAMPLERLIGNYVKYCQDEMAEILTRR